MLPAVVLALIYVWNLFILPATFFAILMIEAARGSMRLLRRRPGAGAATESAQAVGLSRRDLLKGGGCPGAQG